MRRVMIVAAVLCFIGCVSAGVLLFLKDRLFFEPFLFCLTPIPSEKVVMEAIRFGPGDGGPGVGNDGRIYTMKPLECPHSVGVGTPKLTMQLRIQEGKRMIDEKHIGVMIIDPQTVVISGMR